MGAQKGWLWCPSDDQAATPEPGCGTLIEELSRQDHSITRANCAFVYATCCQQVVPLKVTHGDVYVSERFIGWQEKALVALQAAYQPATKVLLLLVPCV